MQWKAIFRLLAILILFFSLSMVFPLAIAFFLGEAEMISAFVITSLLSSAVAVLLLLLTRKSTLRFSAKDGFMLVFLTWIIASFMGALPFYLSRHIPAFADAVFESVSGFTTTGTSIIADVEIMPRSFLFWRAETHWLGGMGIIVLTVALLPFLGSGGFQLLKAETTGPDKDRFTPRITQTARILWLIYISMTALETVLLVAAGMGWFDAIVHSFSTIATGGFSSRNSGLAHWNSTAIVWIVTVFMILAGFNFTLIFRALMGKWKDAWDSSEGRAYIGIIVVSTAIIAAALLLAGQNTNTDLAESGAGIAYGRPLSSVAGSVRTAMFYTASVLTSTGFGAGGLSILPPLAGTVLFFLMFIGGCSGSTAGGVKVIRFVVLFKQAVNELKKALFRQGVFSVHLNKKAGRKDVVYGVAGFIALYFILAIITTLIVASSGLNVYQSFTSALISIGNIGLDPGMENPAAVFGGFPDYVKWTLSYIMIVGRLELWTAVMFFSKEFWR